MNLKTSLFALVLLLASLAGRAQLATVDSKKVFASMPVFAKIDTLTNAEYGKYSQEYIKKKLRAQLLVTAADSVQRAGAKGTQQAQSTAAAQAAIKEFKDFEAEANRRVAEYKEILLKPYVDAVNKAIKVVARALRYKQVLDVQLLSFAYVDPAGDITEAVIAELRKE